jgi:hypothetical protein
MTTILPAADIRALIQMRDDVQRAAQDAYPLGAKARDGFMQLESDLYDIGEALTVATVKLDKAILLAAAERPDPKGFPKPLGSEEKHP